MAKGGRFMAMVVVHSYPDPDDQARIDPTGL